METPLETLLFLDTETGGTDPQESSLLSIGIAVWKNLEIIQSIELLVKEDHMKVNEEALRINGIDLNQHMTQALDSSVAFEILIDFLKENFSERQKITLVGHNIAFDINFLRVFFKKNNSRFDNFFSHRSIDTASILYFLYLSGKLKRKIISSDEAFHEFQIPTSNRHSALGDCLATAKLFNTLIKIDQEVTLPDFSQRQ